MKASIIIPARWASGRFPGKVLASIRGTSLIKRVWRIAQRVKGIEGAWVATDDERIQKHCQAFTDHVIMTSSNCRNGTERVWEAAVNGKLNCDVYINLQGDAPLLPPYIIEAVIEAMRKDPSIQVATPVVECRNGEKAGAVAATYGADFNALYFSRHLTSRPKKANDVFTYSRHVGLYAYRAEALEKYVSWKSGTLEMAEGLEQLRFIENGVAIRVVAADYKGREEWEVNFPQDIAIVEEILARQGEL